MWIVQIGALDATLFVKNGRSMRRKKKNNMLKPKRNTEPESNFVIACDIIITSLSNKEKIINGGFTND